jgi:hypothetical protein
MVTINVMIVNNKNKFFKYAISESDFAEGLAAGDNSKACLKAIDKYLENELKFGQFCAVTKDFWETVARTTQSDVDIRISYANGFCRKDMYRIKNIFVITKEY